jgi:hypothetical protein
VTVVLAIKARAPRLAQRACVREPAEGLWQGDTGQYRNECGLLTVPASRTAIGSMKSFTTALKIAHTNAASNLSTT